MKYFFTPEALLPSGSGFALYGRQHICYLIISASLCAGLCLCYYRLNISRRRKMRLAMGAAILLCEAFKEINLAVHGVLGIYYLPLHLCGLAVFLSFAHSLCPGETLGNLLYSTCMPGALAAILFPDWTVYPAFSFHCILGFTVHTLLVAYPLAQVLSGDIKPRIKLLPRCLAALLSMAAPVYVFDRLFDANYMFLMQPAAGSPLEWFSSLLGNPGYLLGYIPMILLVWGALYLPFRKKGDKDRRPGVLD